MSRCVIISGIRVINDKISNHIDDHRRPNTRQPIEEKLSPTKTKLTKEKRQQTKSNHCKTKKPLVEPDSRRKHEHRKIGK